jgi:hypothetical protein
MKTSKYSYIYLLLAIMIFSNLFLTNSVIKIIFFIIIIFLILLLGYDFYKKKLAYSTPSVIGIIWDLFILYFVITNMREVFNEYNLFIILFGILFIIKMFFTERISNKK